MHTLNEATLRKAVELADGWDYHPNGQHTAYMSGPDGIDVEVDEVFPQTTLDALAAQLTRQVDALDSDEIFVDSNKFETTVFLTSGICDCDDGKYVSIEGPDRTANTIEAIVNSGVLERDDE